jgi:hypothetical protein
VKRFLPTLEWSTLVQVCNLKKIDSILRGIIIECSMYFDASRSLFSHLTFSLFDFVGCIRNGNFNLATNFD